jgi:DNA-binding NarL/FixJ family response regulator
MAGKLDGNIKITPGKDLSELPPEEITNGLAGIQSALEKGLLPGMKEVIAANPKLSIPRMATGAVIPLSVSFAIMREEIEERRHREIIDAISGKQSEAQEFIQPPPPYQQDVEKVREYSLDGRRTIKEIARMVGVSVSTVKRYRKKLGIRRKK